MTGLRRGRAAVEARLGRVTLMALRSRGPCLAILRDGPPPELTAVAMAPDGAPLAGRTVPGPGETPAAAAARALATGALAPAALHEALATLCGGEIGYPSLAQELVRDDGVDTDAAAAFEARIPDLLAAAGFPGRFVDALAALRGLSHTAGEQRRLLFSDDPEASGMRAFAGAYPYLADEGWAAALQACRAGADPFEAVRAATGGGGAAPLPAATLHRFAGVPACDFARAALCAPLREVADLLRATPLDWFPDGRRQRLAFARLARVLPAVAATTGVPVATLARACAGDWVALRDRCRALASVPGDGDRPIEAAIRDLPDFPNRLGAAVVAPLLARVGGDAGDEGLLPRARRLAGRLVYGGRTLAAILEASRRFHAAAGRIEAALPDRIGPDEAWDPIAGPVRDGDLLLVPLRTGREIVEEGASGPDRNGVPGLDHCVGGYRSAARLGLVDIVSVRRPLSGGGYARVATAEVRLGRRGAAEVAQLRGHRNAGVAPDVEDAVRRFAAGPFRARRRPAEDGLDPVAGACGYDWRDDGAVRAALHAFDPVLPRAARGLGLDGFAEALGLPAPASGLTRFP